MLSDGLLNRKTEAVVFSGNRVLKFRDKMLADKVLTEKKEINLGGIPEISGVPKNISHETVEFLRGLIESFNKSFSPISRTNHINNVTIISKRLCFPSHSRIIGVAGI